MVDANNEVSVQEALRWTMNQRQGRLVLQWLLRTSGFTDDVFHPNNSQMSFNAGRRSVGVELIQAVRSIDPDQFTKLIGDIL